MLDRRRPTLAAVAALASLVAAACGGASEAAAPAPGPSRTATAAPSPTPVAVPTTVAPLTGVPVDDPALASRPVVAVKVENSAAARPQAGLEQADIVFEEIVEGGITRFAAIFHSQVPDVVGPIRSGRPEDAAVMPAFRPMLYMSGLRAEVRGMLDAAGIEWIREDGVVMYRDRSRRSPHNVFAAGEDLVSFAESRGVPPADELPWVFSERPPAGGAPATSLTVAMSGASRTGWEWDAAAGVYRRLQDGAPQRVTGPGRVGAANVVVLGMAVGTKGCCDSAGNAYPHTEVSGAGRAVVLRDGKRWDGTWSKSSAREHVVLSVAGRPFAFDPGPTWVLLAPASSLPSVP